MRVPICPNLPSALLGIVFICGTGSNLSSQGMSQQLASRFMVLGHYATSPLQSQEIHVSRIPRQLVAKSLGILVPRPRVYVNRNILGNL